MGEDDRDDSLGPVAVAECLLHFAVSWWILPVCVVISYLLHARHSIKYPQRAATLRRSLLDSQQVLVSQA
jgi:hypothetical protein